MMQTKGRLELAAVLTATLLCVSLVRLEAAPGKDANPTPKKIDIDLDKASQVALPKATADLKPAAFQTADGKSGWIVRLPGGRPIATPAYADGLVFVGGGYGSHEFYAFNADNGVLTWKISTKDDGPTAAVVEDGYVAFNTESCTVIVVDEKTGKLVWEEWLGDPLMSQPAISKGKLFMAYPAGQRGNGRPGHRLLAVNLKTGKHLWEQVITADVISAPVVSGDVVYLTCFDGTSFALDANDGRVIWKKAQSGTSAPVIANNQVVLTRRVQDGRTAYEGMARLDAKQGSERDRELLAKGKAEYLTAGQGANGPLPTKTLAQLDASVGFASAPAAAKISAAEQNVGVSTVVGGWAYQGSRAAYSAGQVLNAQGRYLNSVRAADGAVTWQAETRSARVRDNMQVFSPPAIGVRNMYLTSSFGHILSITQKDGSVNFNYALDQPIAFQPALARGNVYAGTANGMLVCLKTGQSDADGWYAWGGNAQHNKN